MAIGPFGEILWEIQTFGYPLIEVFFGILALGQVQEFSSFLAGYLDWHALMG
jgi:hypothetical protein